jgi:hypothetical protein
MAVRKALAFPWKIGASTSSPSTRSIAVASSAGSSIQSALRVFVVDARRRMRRLMRS